MRIRSFYIFVLVGAALTCRASITMPDDATIISGAGTFTCGEFWQAFKKDPRHFGGVYYSWAQGYMGGINGALAAHNKPITDLAKMTVESQRLRLMNYCDQHPLDAYFIAVEKLFADMRAEQGLPDWRAVE